VASPPATIDNAAAAWNNLSMPDPDRPTRWLAPDASTVIAVLSLVISLITLGALSLQTAYLGAQVEKMQEQTELAINDAFYAKAFELQQIFVERPELWPYFYHGRDFEPDTLPETAAQLEAIALLKLDYFELIEMIYRTDLMDQENVAGTRAYILHSIENSPVLRRVYERHRDWYPKLQRYFGQTLPKS
jgi:hypothetical protein